MFLLGIVGLVCQHHSQVIGKKDSSQKCSIMCRVICKTLPTHSTKLFFKHALLWTKDWVNTNNLSCTNLRTHHHVHYCKPLISAVRSITYIILTPLILAFLFVGLSNTLKQYKISNIRDLLFSRHCQGCKIREIEGTHKIWALQYLLVDPLTHCALNILKCFNSCWMSVTH